MSNIELKNLYNLIRHPDETLDDYFSSENIELKFIPPKSRTSVIGRHWEARVKSFKFHFKRVIGTEHLSLEEFLRVILEIENVLNSKTPLTLVTRFRRF